MEYIGTFFALQLIWSWAHRGGSMSLPFKSRRWSRLLVTPAFILLSLIWVTPVSWTTYICLILGAAAFYAAQADGWGRQMDLGGNDRIDDETGYWIRDLIFDRKSSFARDLTGLYMRMARFLPAAILFYFVSPWAIIIPLSLVLFAPLIWIAEHKWIKGSSLDPSYLWWDTNQKVAWVEWLTGVMLFLTTLMTIWVM